MKEQLRKSFVLIVTLELLSQGSFLPSAIDQYFISVSEDHPVMSIYFIKFGRRFEGEE